MSARVCKQERDYWRKYSNFLCAKIERPTKKGKFSARALAQERDKRKTMAFVAPEPRHQKEEKRHALT